jgi:error-prone DNA polymerase
MRRVDVPPQLPLAAVAERAAGLVCLSGCATDGVHDEPTLRELLAAFGPDHLRVELQRPFLRHDRARNRALADLAARLKVAPVATGNVHVHARERAPLQDAFVALRNHTSLDASEPLRRGNFAHVLAPPEAMAARFPEYPEAVAETVTLAGRLKFDLRCDLGYRYPGAEDEEALGKLAELCWVKLHERYPEGSAHAGAARARLEQELQVIDSLGLAGFFLLHRDLLELAREVAVQVRGPSSVRALLPPGRGRGSSVSSIVCYLTGLSHIDPISNELFLGRFLNEELTSLPDIDLDFPRDIREVLIPRVHERYGREHSALVAAFPTFRSRGAIRELGKVLGLPPGELERVARGAEPFAVRGVVHDVETALGIEHGGPPPPLNDPDNRAPFAMSTEEWMAMVNGLDPADVAERIPDETRFAALPGRWSWLARLCDEAYGLPRHLSQHSGGMIVSTRPLVDCCPVVPAAMEGRQLCQWDKDSCADAGFLKIDLLGLGMLSAVERCVEYIERTRGERIDLSRIPFDDRDTYTAIQEADTMGVFQIESRAQMQSLYRTRPENLDDITIQVAIVRPGPILGGAVNPYIQRKQRMREDPEYEVPYDHPSLEPVLRDTLGTIIFQDQVIEVAMAFAGFSPGEAEGLRRAMSRKRSAAAIEGYHRRFVEGAVRTHGVDEEIAERVYTMIMGFSGFGFPKAHGAAFGLLAYQSTWLRVHHGPEFLCALLNEQPMGFYAPDTLAHEAQRRGIEMAAPDINASDVECTVEWVAPSSPSEDRPAPSGSSPSEDEPAPLGRVRVGLGYVLGVRRDEVEALVAARRERGPFRSLADLASRGGRAARRWRSSPGPGRATRSAARAARRCGSSASPRPARSCPRARSSRCRSRCPRRPSSGRSTAGRAWSPTTPPPASRSARTR